MAESTCSVYGATWCGDTRRTRAFLDRCGVTYEWHDIDEDPTALEVVLDRAGKRKVPVVVFRDDTHLVEPSDEEVADKLGIDST